MAVTTSGGRHGEGKMVGFSTKKKFNKKDKTKLTPLPVDPCELYCTPVVFARFVCALLSFHAQKFPKNTKPKNLGKLFCTAPFMLVLF